MEELIRDCFSIAATLGLIAYFGTSIKDELEELREEMDEKLADRTADPGEESVDEFPGSGLGVE